MNFSKPTLNIGVVGSGFMGKTHVYGYAIADRVFDLPYKLNLISIADINSKAANSAAKKLGFQKSTADWMSLINDPELDLISITAPNSLHKDISIAALEANKHVYCEKPLAPTLEETQEMVKASRRSNKKTQVGFNYLSNPMFYTAKEIIANGDLGEIISFRGIHAEDYMSDPRSPYTWRHEPLGGGVLADLGSHILATAEFLLGPIKEVMGESITVIKKRKTKNNKTKNIKIDDISRSFVRFKSGVSGSLEANWLATGCKMKHDFEIYGTKGAIRFSQERLNELYLFSLSDKKNIQGFRKIEAGPANKPYDRFCVAPGHQLGFNELKAIEISNFIKSINNEIPEPFNFASGHRIQKLVDGIHRSSKEKRWVMI